MKKAFSLMLAALILLSVCLLSGCGGKDNAETTTQAPETTAAHTVGNETTQAAPQQTAQTEPQAAETTAYEGELSCVMVGFGRDVVDLEACAELEVPPYETFLADDSEYGEYIAFMQTEGGKIRDFRFYRLNNTDFVDGKLTFNAEELYSRPTLSDIDPVLIRMTFFGTMPSYAFSYIDEEGMKAYSINLSGMDGSIVLDEIEL